MVGLQSSGDRGALVATCVQDMLAVVVLRRVQQRLDSRLHEAPCSRVQRLLLTPDDILCVRVPVEVLLELSPGEWVQLFDAGKGGIPDTFAAAVLDQGCVHLPSAENHSLDGFRVVNGYAMLGLWDGPLEVRVASEVFDVGASQRMTEQVFAPKYY